MQHVPSEALLQYQHLIRCLQKALVHEVLCKSLELSLISFVFASKSCNLFIFFKGIDWFSRFFEGLLKIFFFLDTGCFSPYFQLFIKPLNIDL